jgi:hypothetical protein
MKSFYKYIKGMNPKASFGVHTIVPRRFAPGIVRPANFSSPIVTFRLYASES